MIKRIGIAAVVGTAGCSYLCPPEPVPPRVIDCSGDKLEFDDADTIYCDGEKIRILGMDAPEIEHREHGIFEDQPFGRQAAEYAEQIFEKAKRVTVLAGEKGKYGRTLGHVFIDGQLYAVRMIRDGWAYETISRYGDGGFPGLAQMILEVWEETWKDGERPPFENPRDWRKKHQVKISR